MEIHPPLALVLSNAMLMPLRVLLNRRALERSCRWTRAELHAHRLRSLQALRQFACRNSPFYRRFHRGLESRPLSELPILTKASVAPREGSVDPVADSEENGGGRMMRPRKLVATIVAVVAVVLAVWVLVDLTNSSRHDLRQFDGHDVARLETAMWRSYYAHERFKLFRELAELLRLQYRLPFCRSYVAAYSAAHAAAVFQSGHNRTEYLRALPDLESFYSQIRRHSETPFDVRKVAASELEWWIVHRERALHQPGDLEAPLADLQSLIYRQPAARFEDHAKARAEAMLLRDGSPSKPDWRRIGALLDQSWVSLHAAASR